MLSVCSARNRLRNAQCATKCRYTRRFLRQLSLSQTEGPTSPPLLHHTLPAFFDKVILPAYSDCSALISRHERASNMPGPKQQNSSPVLHWTFKEFDDRIAAVSCGLIKLGVTNGDRVAVIMGNNRSVKSMPSHKQGLLSVTYETSTLFSQAPTPSYNGRVRA